MNQLNKNTDQSPCPDILKNIVGVDTTDKCPEKVINTDEKPCYKPLEETTATGGWKTKDWELASQCSRDVLSKGKKRQRKIKRGLGWTFWVACLPLALFCHCVRESPVDVDDPFDYHDDPLRPWNYKINLPRV